MKTISSTIFVVEDDTFYNNLIVNTLKENGITKIQSFFNGQSFLDNLSTMPDIVLLDHDLGDTTGIIILKKIKLINPNIHVIFLSAQEKMNVAINALKYGAYDYIEKNRNALVRVVRMVRRISRFDTLMAEKQGLKKFKIITVAFVLVIIMLIYALKPYFPHLFYD